MFAHLGVQTVLDEALDVLQDLPGQQHHRSRAITHLFKMASWYIAKHQSPC